MRIAIAFLLFVATTTAVAQPARSIRGVVFDDRNHNERRDPGEPGRGGVVVSDQYSVTTSAADGAWQLDISPSAQVVSVSVPDGWASVGRFWRPLYVTVEGMGATPQFDFPLQQDATGADFKFIHASDTHLSQASLPRIQALRALADREKPAFVLITGDLVRDALRVGEAEANGYYRLFVDELSKFTVPVWTVPGNHENFGIERNQSKVDASNPLYGKKMYRHYLGPNYYSFTRGGIRFLGLDSVDVDDMWYYGHVDAAQLDWMKADLRAASAAAPVVTFNHIPFVSAADATGGYTEEPPAPSLIRINGKPQYRHIVSNTADVLAALAPHRLEIALGGHLHQRESISYESAAGLLRFHQAAAVVGPNGSPLSPMPSGVTLYQVRGGHVDNGAFMPLK
jgi:hypothetical protein